MEKVKREILLKLITEKFEQTLGLEGILYQHGRDSFRESAVGGASNPALELESMMEKAEASLRLLQIENTTLYNDIGRRSQIKEQTKRHNNIAKDVILKSDKIDVLIKQCQSEFFEQRARNEAVLKKLKAMEAAKTEGEQAKQRQQLSLQDKGKLRDKIRRQVSSLQKDMLTTTNSLRKACIAQTESKILHSQSSKKSLHKCDSSVVCKEARELKATQSYNQLLDSLHEAERKVRGLQDEKNQIHEELSSIRNQNIELEKKVEFLREIEQARFTILKCNRKIIGRLGELEPPLSLETSAVDFEEDGEQGAAMRRSLELIREISAEDMETIETLMLSDKFRSEELSYHPNEEMMFKDCSPEFHLEDFGRLDYNPQHPLKERQNSNFETKEVAVEFTIPTLEIIGMTEGSRPESAYVTSQDGSIEQAFYNKPLYPLVPMPDDDVYQPSSLAFFRHDGQKGSNETL